MVSIVLMLLLRKMLLMMILVMRVLLVMMIEVLVKMVLLVMMVNIEFLVMTIVLQVMKGASSVDDVGIDESATCTGDATEDDGDVGESVSVEKVFALNGGVPGDDIVDIDRVIDDKVLSVG